MWKSGNLVDPATICRAASTTLFPEFLSSTLVFWPAGIVGPEKDFESHGDMIPEITSSLLCRRA
jgi:hypothetical protein